MNRTASSSSPSTSRLVEIVDDYLTCLRKGTAPNREQLLALHPDLAEDLRACLECLEFIGQATGVDEARSSREIAQPIPAGTPLGDYRLLREIGRGGMGVVYEAEQTSLGRRVALKVLPFATMLDPRQLNRFKNEAHAAAVLHHPHIVPVFGVGCERGVHFYVMQLIEGQSLAELVSEQQHEKSLSLLPTSPAANPAAGEKGRGEGTDTNTISSAQHRSATTDTSPTAALTTAGASRGQDRARVVAELGLQAAEALDYAHREGVIHRDVKPSNLLVDRSGRLWIADFGLARMQSGNNITLSGDMLGTLRYMSPEQVFGNQVVDERTDVYSLGLTLYELLLRRPAFINESRERMIRRIIEEDPVPPRKIESSIPVDFETIILRATAKDRDARYQCAQDLAQDLRRFLDCKPIRARRVTRLQRLRYWARRNTGIAILTATVGLLLIAFTVAAVATSVRLLKIAEEQAARLYAADINRAKEAFDNGDLALARRLLREYEATLPDGKDWRGFEWFYLNELCHLPAREMPHREPVFQVAFSPDGKLLATCEVNGRMIVWDARTLSPLWETGGTSEMVSLAFRRGGQQLVSGDRNGTVRVWDVATRKELFRRDVGDKQVFAVAVSATNDLIAFARSPMFINYPAQGQAEIIIWDPEVNQTVGRFGELRGQVVCLAFSPDGTVLAAGTYDTSVRLWKTSDWQELPSLPGHSSGIFSLAFSDDGTFLASGSGVWTDRFVLGEIKLWNTSDWNLVRTLRGHTNRVHALCFWRDAETLLSGGSDGTLSVWDLSDSSRLTPIRTILAHGQWVRSLAVSPSGTEIASGGYDNLARLWTISELMQAQPNPMRRELPGVIPWHLAFVDRGSAICVSDLGGSVVLQDRDTGRIRFQVTGTPAEVTDFAVNEQADLLTVVRDRLKQTPDATISVHQLSTGDVRWTRELPGGYYGRAHDISPSGPELAVGTGNSIHFFDARSGSFLFKIGPIWSRTPERWAIRFSPDGDYLAYASEGTKTYLLNARSWQVVAEFDTKQQGIWTIEFSPSVDRLATAGDDGSIMVWDINSQRLIATCIGHTDIVYSLDYSSDGRRLLSASRDGSVRIWDTESYQSVMTMTEHNGFVTRAIFSPDDQTVASCGDDRHLVLRYAN